MSPPAGYDAGQGKGVPVIELLRSNDPVLISFAESLLVDADADALVEHLTGVGVSLSARFLRSD